MPLTADRLSTRIRDGVLSIIEGTMGALLRRAGTPGDALTALGLSLPLPVAQGGTGATTATAGASALGLGASSAPTFAGLTTSAGATFNTSGKQVLIGGGDQTGSELRLTNLGSAHFSMYNVGGYLTFANTNAGNPSVTNTPGTAILKLGVDASAQFFGLLIPRSYTVATLPPGTSGALLFVSDARKPSEGAGAGTGVVAEYSAGAWRRPSDYSTVIA